MSVQLSLVTVFQLLASNSHINFFKDSRVLIETSDNRKLLEIAENKIVTPVENFLEESVQYRSKLHDSFVDQEKLSQLIDKLNREDGIIRLNHVGFCYKVESQTEELERLKIKVTSSGLNLYQEPSNDAGLWLFAGDTKVWSDPLVEYLPVENSDDPHKDYWLPHVQIDLDTKYSPDEIIDTVNSIFGGNPPPFPVTVIDGVVYTIRFRLGIADGINIDLDLATKNRQVQYHREKILKLML